MAPNSKLIMQAAAWALVAFVWYIVYCRYNKYMTSYSKTAEPLPTSFEPFIDIPSIDISSFYQSADTPNIDSLKQKVSKQIADASTKYGSFYIAIPDHDTYNIEYRDKLISNAYKLFNVNNKLKQSFSTKPDSSRGFILYGAESGSTEYFEHKEGFCYGYYNWSIDKNNKHIPNNDMESYNIFPPLSDIEKSFEKLFDIFIELSYILIKAYSIILYNDENILFNQFNGGQTISIVRLFHYFSLQHEEYLHKLQKNTDNYLGSSPHTDWGLLTLIIADNMPGLQLLFNNEWYSVKPRFNESLILVNCGDFMSILSDGQFVSPLHRVLSPMDIEDGEKKKKKKDERMSFVFFFYPQYNAKIPTSKTKREYSLLHDQSKMDKSLNNKFDLNMSFGSYIKQKWKQVTRN